MLVNTIKNMFLAALGAQETVMEFINDLVKKGELSETQGSKIIKEWTEKAEKTTHDMSFNFSDIITKALEKMNLPSKEDVDALNKKVNTLSQRLNELEETIHRQGRTD